jgi:hypothetical protein
VAYIKIGYFSNQSCRSYVFKITEATLVVDTKSRDLCSRLFISGYLVDIVDNTVLLSLSGIHEEVAVGVLFNFAELLAGGFGEHLV